MFKEPLRLTICLLCRSNVAFTKRAPKAKPRASSVLEMQVCHLGMQDCKDKGQDIPETVLSSGLRAFLWLSSERWRPGCHLSLGLKENKGQYGKVLATALKLLEARVHYPLCSQHSPPHKSLRCLLGSRSFFAHLHTSVLYPISPHARNRGVTASWSSLHPHSVSHQFLLSLLNHLPCLPSLPYNTVISCLDIAVTPNKTLWLLSHSPAHATPLHIPFSCQEDHPIHKSNLVTPLLKNIPWFPHPWENQGQTSSPSIQAPSGIAPDPTCHPQPLSCPVLKPIPAHVQTHHAPPGLWELVPVPSAWNALLSCFLGVLILQMLPLHWSLSWCLPIPPGRTYCLHLCSIVPNVSIITPKCLSVHYPHLMWYLKTKNCIYSSSASPSLSKLSAYPYHTVARCSLTFTQSSRQSCKISCFTNQ